MLEIRQCSHPDDAKLLTTDELRERFLIENLFNADEIKMVYSHYDRYIIGGCIPVKKTLKIEEPELKTEYFLERREMAFLNTAGGKAVITVEGQKYVLNNKDALYVGKGNKEVTVASEDAANPCMLYFVSCTAHMAYPTVLIDITKATPAHMGDKANCNERTIYKYIHADGIAKSCQLMLGVTILEKGSIWNTMPVHTHDRRMEAYLYFDLGPDNVVFHLMGEPTETRHLVMKDHEAVISPTWSIHSAAGTANYAFCWAMAGENYTFTDQDFIKPVDMK